MAFLCMPTYQQYSAALHTAISHGKHIIHQLSILFLFGNAFCHMEGGTGLLLPFYSVARPMAHHKLCHLRFFFCTLSSAFFHLHSFISNWTYYCRQSSGGRGAVAGSHMRVVG